MFAAIGMAAFAERARRELIATGENVRKRSAEATDDADRAGGTSSRGWPATACTNAEIGAQLYISTRGRSNGTCARSSPSSASAPGGNCDAALAKSGRDAQPA